MRARWVLTVAALAVGMVVVAPPAGASEQFGDLDVSFLSLKVNASGEALVTYRTSRRTLRHVYVWGAINAIAPDPTELQVRFHYDYTGGWKKSGRQSWRSFHGFHTPSPTKRDLNARFFYVDTFNSIFGAGWKHDAGKVAHNPNGAFCYSFVPQPTPRGYPIRELRPPGNGQRHRVTVMGPGVTPVIQWEGPALGPYDPQGDARFNTLFDRIVGPADRVCVPER